MTSVRARTAFVFAGGGSLGAVQVGMLRALTEAGVHADFVIGSSVGAVNAAYYAGGGGDLACVRRLEALWHGLHRRDVFPVRWRAMLNLLRRAEALIDPPIKLRNLVLQNIQFARLEDAPIPLHVVATNLRGKAVCLSSGPAIDAILASAAIPGIFPPVRVGNDVLLDGGVANNAPILTASRLGATRIIVLPTGFACALSAAPHSAMTYAMHALTLVIAQQLMRDLRQVSRSAEVRIPPVLCPQGVSPFDFSHGSDLIERAAKSTQGWLAGGGLERLDIPEALLAHEH